MKLPTKIVLIILSLVLLISMAACQSDVKKVATDMTGNNALPASTKAEVPTEIIAKFSPIAVKNLPEEQPQAGLTELKSQVFTDILGQNVIVKFYGKKNESKGEITAIIDNAGKTYNLGIIGNYGVEGVGVSELDINNDKVNELWITGSNGASSSVSKLVGYNGTSGTWDLLLDTGYVEQIDLDGDGSFELVSTSTGSLPPFVYIYRWNGSSFEMLDVASAAGAEYAGLKDFNLSYWFETGKKGNKTLYKYINGRLVKYDRPFASLQDYILPDSDKKLLSEQDVTDLGPFQIDLARNEIYARHGYIFKTEYYKDYFSSCDWYSENPGFSESMLNKIEAQNTEFLKQYNQKITDNFKPVKNSSTSVDLNGDGIVDNVTLDCKTGADSYKLKVNDSVVTGTGENLNGVLFICDIDSKDNYKELAITESGPSDDYAAYFYFYDGKSLKLMGKTSGDENTVKMTGDGVFTTKTRGQILQTWYYTDYYKLSTNHELVNIPKEFYNMNTIVSVKKEFILQKFPTDTSRAVTLKPGEDALIVGSDNKEWCMVENSKGQKGWFAMDNFDTIKGTELRASDIFSGLCYAD
ncbi:MAG: YARHG domain-containing protein [Bacillota bacterium]|nr:YARHG domain-containing protein [Bacillota bacterium]